MSEATKEAVYWRTFLRELGFLDYDDATVILNDNQGAQKLVKNGIFHNRTKHIDIRHHFIREQFEIGEINIDYISTEDQCADILTKGLFSPKHFKCMNELGITEN